MAKKIQPEDLVIHILNVGFGDTILVEFPVREIKKKIKKKKYERPCGVVDCRNSGKLIKYIEELTKIDSLERTVEFVCATHPHKDHIEGINPILRHKKYHPKEFWDSGFRQKSTLYLRILKTLLDKKIKMLRISTGMEWYFGKVRITVLSPSVTLRNRYGTHGIDMNNASIVLRLEHHGGESLVMVSKEYEGNKSDEAVRAAGSAVVILAGDAEFEAWAQISQDFATHERHVSKKLFTPLITKMVNYLSCSVLKVSHHGSMHSAPLDIYEKIKPDIAIVSTLQEESEKKEGVQVPLKRYLFPHKSATIALEESGALVLTTDGSYTTPVEDAEEKGYDKPGSIVVVVPPGGPARIRKLDDTKTDDAYPPDEV